MHIAIALPAGVQLLQLQLHAALQKSFTSIYIRVYVTFWLYPLAFRPFNRSIGDIRRVVACGMQLMSTKCSCNFQCHCHCNLLLLLQLLSVVNATLTNSSSKFPRAAFTKYKCKCNSTLLLLYGVCNFYLMFASFVGGRLPKCIQLLQFKVCVRNSGQLLICFVALVFVCCNEFVMPHLLCNSLNNDSQKCLAMQISRIGFSCCTYLKKFFFLIF